MYYLDKKVKYNSQDFKALFNAYFPALCLYAERIVSDSDAAKDVVQEVFIKLLKSNAMFENEKAIKAYLYILTRNSCLDSIKKSRNDLRLTNEELFSYSENEEELNISVNTVKTLKLRAYKKLRGILSHQFMTILMADLFI